MSMVPNDKPGKIQWFEDHVQRFTTNAVAIGTTAADVSDLQTKTQAARAAYDAQELAIDEARDATQACTNAVNAMGVKGAGIIKQVRAKGESSGNPNVYVLAGIPAPTTPSARPVPGKPFQFKVALLDGGAIDMTFKCNNPGGSGGTIYQFYRKAAGEPESAFVYIGGSGEKRLTDDGIPAGVTSVVYQVQAVRSTRVGQFAQFNVNFGTSASGNATATLVEMPVKMAA